VKGKSSNLVQLGQGPGRNFCLSRVFHSIRLFAPVFAPAVGGRRPKGSLRLRLRKGESASIDIIVSSDGAAIPKGMMTFSIAPMTNRITTNVVDNNYIRSNSDFMGKTLLEIGPLEMEVLGHLNSGGEQSVGDIQAGLKKFGNELAYTTVMTVLVRLHNKGLVQRRKESRYFLYSAAKRKDSTPFKIFEKVKNSLFRAERLTPILSLLDSEEDFSKAELEELKRAVEAKLKRT